MVADSTTDASCCGERGPVTPSMAMRKTPMPATLKMFCGRKR
jgi:hypothetical protein